MSKMMVDGYGPFHLITLVRQLGWQSVPHRGIRMYEGIVIDGRCLYEKGPGNDTIQYLAELKEIPEGDRLIISGWGYNVPNKNLIEILKNNPQSVVLAGYKLENPTYQQLSSAQYLIAYRFSLETL